MQTFLPYQNFRRCAKTLDWRRLGKQRVEAKQIHNVLVGESNGKGWQNHPAVLMWQGYEYQLCAYHNCMIEEWIARGYNNNMQLMRPAIYEVPSWINSQLIESHRSNLLRKEYSWYKKFSWNLPDNLEYYWPSKQG